MTQTQILQKVILKREKDFLNLKAGGWSNYDKKTISKGGGIFLRSAIRRLTLSPEIKKMIGSTKVKVIISGEDLMYKSFLLWKLICYLMVELELM